MNLSTSSVFSSGVLLGARTADAERSSPIYYAPIDAVWAKYVVLGKLIDMSHPMKVLLAKTPQIGDGNKNFQHKRLPANLGSEETNHNALWLKTRFSARHT